MKRLIAVLLVVAPVLAVGDAFKDVYDYCRYTNQRFGSAVAEVYCKCLDAELKKRVTEADLTAYFGRPGTPEDRVIDEKAGEAASVCREKVDREFKSI